MCVCVCARVYVRAYGHVHVHMCAWRTRARRMHPAPFRALMSTGPAGPGPATLSSPLPNAPTHRANSCAAPGSSSNVLMSKMRLRRSAARLCVCVCVCVNVCVCVKMCVLRDQAGFGDACAFLAPSTADGASRGARQQGRPRMHGKQRAAAAAAACWIHKCCCRHEGWHMGSPGMAMAGTKQGERTAHCSLLRVHAAAGAHCCSRCGPAASARCTRCTQLAALSGWAHQG